jgi:hypothetical protein
MRILPIVILLGASLSTSGCETLDRIVDDIAAAADLGTSERSTPPPPAARRSLDGVPPPIFGDWWYFAPAEMRTTKRPRLGDPCAAVPGFVYRDVNTYVPVNVPGAQHGGPSYVRGEWMDWYARCFTDKLAASGAPVAVLIRERNCPYPYGTGGNAVSPREVPAMLDAVPRLDYLLMDLEPIRGGTDRDVIRNVEEVVRLVRSHPNPRVSNAFIGNYNDWPGLRDTGRIWPDKRDRTRVSGRWDRNRFYRDNLNVAMPIAYPYETYSRHSDAKIQKGPTTPNDRAAAFWAPIERVSVAARNLPEGHLLIPWVSSFIDHDGNEAVYHAPPPTRQDLEAIIRHLRLRGAHSFMVWTPTATRTDHPRIDRQAYKQLAMNAWRSLDPAFPEGDRPAPLNLRDDKSTGLIWSGVVSDGRAWVLVSNLGNRPRSVDLPSLPGVPDRTPEVPAGGHRLFRWTIGG